MRNIVIIFIVARHRRAGNGRGCRTGVAPAHEPTQCVRRRKAFPFVDGVARNYLLHVPDDLPSGKSAPLALVFHGGGGHDWNMPGFTHFDDLADQEGFLVAYPDAVNATGTTAVANPMRTTSDSRAL